MTRSFQGVAKILRFNWPWYVAALVVNALALLLLERGMGAAWLERIAVLGLALADAWLVTSLVVSHWIYDRSGVARGAWLDGLPAWRQAAVFHAGQDEASAALRHHQPDAKLLVFDFFDVQQHTEASLQRARAFAHQKDTPVSQEALPLQDGELDLACVVFAAHEIRDRVSQVTFFAELRRVLNSEGNLRVVEHLRDGWNGLAYGPGAFHFLSRRTWLETFSEAGLVLERESRITPFVAVFSLRRPR